MNTSNCKETASASSDLSCGHHFAILRFSQGMDGGAEFRELDAEIIGAQITSFHCTASMLHRKLRSGTALLKRRVEVWRERLPVFSHLVMNR